MDGEVIHALFGLFDQGLHEDVEVEVLGRPADLLQGLIDGHRADGHRRVANDALAGLVDVGARREVHHRVGPPAHGPAQLVDLLFHRRTNGRVADVGVDLDEEVAADGHRFEFWVTDVGGNDGPSLGDLAHDELFGDLLAAGHEAHLLGDLAAPGPVHLGHVGPAGAAPFGPRASRGRQTLGGRVALRTGAVVETQRRVVARLRDLAVGNGQLAAVVDFFRVREGLLYRFERAGHARM